MGTGVLDLTDSAKGTAGVADTGLKRCGAGVGVTGCGVKVKDRGCGEGVNCGAGVGVNNWGCGVVGLRWRRADCCCPTSIS